MEVVTSSCHKEVEKLLETLERKRGSDGKNLFLYDGFWTRPERLLCTIRFQKHFVARDTDIILCSKPKCGTTWLKALTLSIAKRHVYPIHQSPLLTNNPHILVPFLDLDTYAKTETPDIESLPSPRIFSSHMPYQPLPSSIRESSKCRVIYICRNPLDQFTSDRHYLGQNFPDLEQVEPLEEAFDMFCEGIYPYGPFWDHVSGYWKAHVENPHKVLFLKFEDLKEDVSSHVRKIADFIGIPFSEEEEKEGLVEQIVKLCSLDNLKNLQVNKVINNDNRVGMVKNSSYFRKGQVGDWSNYLTPSMATRFQDILDSKLEGSGLKFRLK